MLLSNKVLEDPRQRRLFKTSDLVELFNFNESIDGPSSESDQLFRESRLTPASAKFSSSKIEKMRRLAATLSKSISQNTINSTPVAETANVSENNNQTSESSSKTLKDETISVPPEKHENIVSNEDRNISETNTEQNKNIIDHNTQDISTGNEIQNKDDAANKNNAENLPSDSNKLDRKRKRSRKKSDKCVASAMFEGERVSYLIGRRLGHSETDRSTSTEDDQYVLEKLFAKASNYFSFYIDVFTGRSKKSISPLRG